MNLPKTGALFLGLVAALVLLLASSCGDSKFPAATGSDAASRPGAVSGTYRNVQYGAFVTFVDGDKYEKGYETGTGGSGTYRVDGDTITFKDQWGPTERVSLNGDSFTVRGNQVMCIGTYRKQK